VRLEVEFVSPARHGDVIEMSLGVEHLGRSSIGFRYEGRVGERVVLRARNRVVTVEMGTLEPIPVPAWLRAALEAASVPAAE
jgi:4-hydroxybenzoyl-CoA thioesterase